MNNSTSEGVHLYQLQGTIGTQQCRKEKMDEHLYSLLGSHDLVNTWWTSCNKAFGGGSPINAWNNNPDSVVVHVCGHLLW